MSKLAEVYARACGIDPSQIGHMEIMEKYYPLPFQNYFTIQAGSGQGAKNYDYWNSVIELLIPLLQQNNITLVQIGGKDDIPLKYCHNLLGQTDTNQSFYIVNRSLFHFGNDSFAAHVVGDKGLPLVECFGETCARNHSPFTYNKDKSIFIESHRNDNLPTFASNESPKTINYIKPEDVAKAVFQILSINYTSPISTWFIGSNYNAFILEFVPDHDLPPSFMPENPVTVRLDLHFDEVKMATATMSGRKVNIVTNKPININLLRNIKSNILGINYEINLNDDLSYIKDLKKLAVSLKFFSKERDKDKLSQIRLKFFDLCQIIFMEDRTKNHFIEDCEKYLNKKLDKEVKFDILSYRSNKFMLAGNKIFTSKAAWKADKSVANFDQNITQVIDNEDFWNDYQFYNIFEKLV